MNMTIKQGIDNCYMAHRYEHLGYEDDRCAGLRTLHGDGELTEECKECALYYGNRFGKCDEEGTDDETN